MTKAHERLVLVLDVGGLDVALPRDRKSVV